MIKINEYEYAFLKGDEEVFPQWGAALSVVYEFCRNQGLGGFGDPTERGRQMMEQYEQETG